MLREIISQAFGISHQSSSLTKFADINGTSKRNEVKSPTLKWKGGSGGKQMNGFMQFSDDWQETGTFTAALEKVESWIFSRIVESVWWQVHLLKQSVYRCVYLILQLNHCDRSMKQPNNLAFLHLTH